MVAKFDANVPIMAIYGPVVNAESIGYDGLRTDF
jgi:hypothetical protein